MPRATVLRCSALATLVTALACRPAAAPVPAGNARADTSAIAADVRYLASDRLEGRGTGTPGNDSAAAYIVRRFGSIGISPAFSSADGQLCPVVTGRTKPCDGRFSQPFVARSVAAAHAGLPAALPTRNVAGIVRGSDPGLRNQFVVVGAHFDHLGRSSFGTLDPGADDAIRNGADDNASGTAAVIELARLLRRDPPRRSLVFVAFSGEELGLLGSQHFVANLPVPRESVQAMLNFDMVGRLADDHLIVYGVATANGLTDVVQRAGNGLGLRITATGDGFGASDHSSFYARDIPVLHFFTNVHEDYHRATDDADKINTAGVARVVTLAERVIRELADRPTRLEVIRAVAAAPASSSREGVTAWLGSVPDMGAVDVAGVRLSAVRPGSPADSAGIKAGDIIVEFDGKPVRHLQDYSDALYARKPGDTISIVVVRDGRRSQVNVTLGRRGS